jgi:WXG100 family type VII secretion target
MPAPRIRADYDNLASAANTFTTEAGQTSDLFQKVQQCVGGLQSGGWLGQGAQAFYQEMESVVIPGMKRLSDALEQSATAVKQISQVFQQAEQQAGALFQKLA